MTEREKYEALTDKEKYQLRLQEEEKTNKLNRLRRIEKAKQQEEEKQKYLRSIQEHSTGNLTWKNVRGGLAWDGFYEDEKYFTASFGTYKYSLVVHNWVKKKFPIQTKKITTSFKLTDVQSAAENMLGNILEEIKRRKKEELERKKKEEEELARKKKEQEEWDGTEGQLSV